MDDRAGLLSLAQRNIVEFHTWNSRASDVERPDRIVFDFDPGPAVAWRDVVSAAKMARESLRGIGLESWVKTTGGKGLHVVIPIAPRHDWAACLEFARQAAAVWAERDPSRYTTRYAKHGRERRILIDYLRNNRTNTSVAAYAVRARPNAPVSEPIAWDELTPRFDPARWTIRTTPRRLARRRDPSTDYFRAEQRLP